MSLSRPFEVTRTWTPLMLTALSLGPFIASSFASASELPRYRLEAGQVLVYRSVDRPLAADMGNADKLVARHDYEWTFYVVGKNNDGTWRVAFRQKWLSRVFSPESDKRDFSQPTTLFEDGYFDLASDGKVAENWTIHSFANPLVAFPPLPPSTESLKVGWESKLSVEGTRRKLRVATDKQSPDSHSWRFVEDDERLEDAVYLTKRRREFDFDSNRGLVRSFVTRTDEGWSGLVRPAVPIELVCDYELKPEELPRLAHDSDLYFAARQEADLLLARAGIDLPHTAQWLEKAGAGFKRKPAHRHGLSYAAAPAATSV